jgi:hypothetical protein
LTAPGETLIPYDVVAIVEQLLSRGHFVNITTNGTLSSRFTELISLQEEFRERLHFSFSFHYLELLRTSLLEAFFHNIHKIRRAGCSFVVQMNLCDDYIPYLNDISNVCVKNIGALPQLAVTRDQIADRISLRTQHSPEEYARIAALFDSALFDFGMINFHLRRKEFCYAGDWSFKLDLKTGNLRSCYDTGPTQNIFEDPNKPIRFQAIGRNCQSPYCVNSTHFMSLGSIPEIIGPTYVALRDRPSSGWYSDRMRTFLGSRLADSNSEYGRYKKLSADIIEYSRASLTSIGLRIMHIGKKLYVFEFR